MTPLLDVRDLAVHFPVRSGARRSSAVVRAVDQVSFTIGAGETLGLVGESGCGKSTTGMAVQGLAAATSGAILLDGVDLTRLKGSRARQVRRRTQMVFQDPTSSLNSRMTIGEILEEPLLVHRIVAPRERRTRVHALLEQVGMPSIGVSRRTPTPSTRGVEPMRPSV